MSKTTKGTKWMISNYLRGLYRHSKQDMKDRKIFDLISFEEINQIISWAQFPILNFKELNHKVFQLKRGSNLNFSKLKLVMI